MARSGARRLGDLVKAVPAGLLVLSGSAAWPDAAMAHVKWFTQTNVHDTPVALVRVLSPIFLATLALFTTLVLLGFLLDNWIVRRLHRPARVPTTGPMEQRLIRAAAGGYFAVSSWHGTTILTPELLTHAAWVPILQFLIALFLVSRPTCILSGLGVLALYAEGIRRYGLFHMTDYVFMPCLAAYIVSLSLPAARLARLREPLLVSGLAFSLAWTAIEKFLYPQWTDAVVATHPSLEMGLPLGVVVVIAGFVEFTLAFYLVTGRSLARLGAAGYAAIFLAAMPVFGKLDVFGHLVILAVLAIVMLRGPTSIQARIHLAGDRLALDAAWITTLYLASLVAFFAAYYALHLTV